MVLSATNGCFFVWAEQFAVEAASRWGLGLRICRKGRLNSEEVKLFFPKPEGIFPNGVNKHSQLSSFIHPSWSKCFLQRWLTHELGLWMKSKHYLWIFQVVLWAGSVCVPFEMEKNCRNHTFSWRNGCVPLTKFKSISPVEVSHEPSERYRFPSCSVTIIFQFPHLKRLSFLRFQEFPSNLMGASLCWFITNFPYSIPSFLIFEPVVFSPKKVRLSDPRIPKRNLQSPSASAPQSWPL